MPRSSDATPSRYRATMSAGGGIGDPAIRYWSVASLRLMRAMASQSCDRLAAAKRLIDGRGVEAPRGKNQILRQACCSQAFDALCWCSGLRRQEQPPVSIACQLRMAPRSAPFLLEDIERRLGQVHRPAVDPLDHDPLTTSRTASGRCRSRIQQQRAVGADGSDDRTAGSSRTALAALAARFQRPAGARRESNAASEGRPELVRGHRESGGSLDGRRESGGASNAATCGDGPRAPKAPGELGRGIDCGRRELDRSLVRGQREPPRGLGRAPGELDRSINRGSPAVRALRRPQPDRIARTARPTWSRPLRGAGHEGIQAGAATPGRKLSSDPAAGGQLDRPFLRRQGGGWRLPSLPHPGTLVSGGLSRSCPALLRRAPRPHRSDHRGRATRASTRA